MAIGEIAVGVGKAVAKGVEITGKAVAKTAQVTAKVASKAATTAAQGTANTAKVTGKTVGQSAKTVSPGGPGSGGRASANKSSIDEEKRQRLAAEARELKRQRAGMTQTAKTQKTAAIRQHTGGTRVTGLHQAVAEGNPLPLIKSMLSAAIGLGKGLSAVRGINKATALSQKNLIKDFAGKFSGGSKSQEQEQKQQRAPGMSFGR